MIDITMTKSGTAIVDGVEYSSYPPPPALLKAMKLLWAEQLVATGLMRFGSLESYQEWENEVLGDPNDGKAMFRMDGHPYTVESSNPVYAWCSSKPDISEERLLLLAQHGAYECVVRIQSPEIFIQRVRAALQALNPKLLIHCSEVHYNRGAEVDKKTLNSQKFHHNVFQKAPFFSDDEEYRLSITDCELLSPLKEHIEVTIGDCSDIMKIEATPSRESRGD